MGRVNAVGITPIVDYCGCNIVLNALICGCGNFDW